MDTRQLNASLVPLAKIDGNYITLLKDTGYLSGFEGSPSSQPKHAKLDDHSETIDNRARSYLAVNCAYCHRDNGGFNTKADAPISLTKMINEDDTGQISIDNSNLKRIRPGHPDDSSVLQRILGSSGFNRMTPIGSSEVDTVGTQLVEPWIKTLNNSENNGDLVDLVLKGPGGIVDSDFAADPDGDGLQNAVDVLMGLNPIKRNF